MELVKDIAQFDHLVREFSLEYQSIYSNIFLMPYEIEKFISDKNFYCHRISNVLLFLRETRDFYYLYFYLPLNEEIVPDLNFYLPHMSKTIITDLVYQEKISNSPPETVQIILKENGFQFHKKYIQMFLSLKNNKEFLQYSIENGGFQFAKLNDYNSIQNLWDQNLNHYSTALPTHEELLRLVLEQKILAIYINEKICALMVLEIKGKTGYISHVVVDPEYRRKGYAYSLIIKTIKNNPSIAKYTLWVEETNIAAFGLYTRLGFLKSSKNSIQFIKA